MATTGFSDPREKCRPHAPREGPHAEREDYEGPHAERVDYEGPHAEREVYTEKAVRFGVLVLAAWGVLGMNSLAAEHPTLRLSDDADPAKGTNLLNQDNLFLRPNVKQNVYLFVDNPTEKPADVVVKCLIGQVPLPDTKATVDKSVRIDIPKAAENAPVELTKPLQIELLDAKGKQLDKKVIRVKILEPREYLDTPVARFQSRDQLAANRWSVKVQAKKGVFFGPPCPVDLVLAPDRIPGLLHAEPDEKVLHQDVIAGGPPVELFAANLPFRDGTDSNGLVSLTVDGFQRAFIFNTHFAPAGNPTPDLVTRPGLRLHVPAYAPPGKLPVMVEVDNWPLREPVTVEVGFDKTGKKGAGQIDTFSGARRQKISVSRPGDYLLFTTEVSDWSKEWNTAGTTGEGTFRARLLNAQKKPIAFTEGSQTVNEVFAKVTLINHDPRGVRLGKLPATVPLGTPALAVTASCADPLDQIASVFFFIGLPAKPKAGEKPGDKPEDKPPEGAVPGTRVVDPDGATRWQARLKIPSDKPGAVPVSVQVVNKIKKSAFATAQVNVVPPPPPSTTGTIVGRVVKGTNAKGQPKLKVILWGKDRKQVAEAQTDGDGNYEFKDVTPGSYTVTSEDVTDKVKGSQAVTVRKGEKATPKDIELSRLGG